MLIEVKQLAKQINNIKKKRNSLYARIEVLKLRGPNRDQKAINNKQQALDELDNKLSELEKILDQKRQP